MVLAGGWYRLVVTRRHITRGISRPARLAAAFAAAAAIVVYAAMWVGYRQQWTWLTISIGPC